MASLRVTGGFALSFVVALLWLSLPVAFAEQAGAQEDYSAAPVPKIYDHGPYTDKIDLPGRLFSSKRVIKLSEKLLPPDLDKVKPHHLPTGPDYVVNIDVDSELKIRGVLMAVRGQSRKIVVEVEGQPRTVLLRANSSPRTSLEALVFLNGIPHDPEKPTAEEGGENRHLARHAVKEALKKWGESNTTITLSYVHYVFQEEFEGGDEEDDR